MGNTCEKGVDLTQKETIRPKVSEETTHIRRLEENNRVETLTRHLEMPFSEGWNSEGWEFRVERFFVAHGMLEEEKLAVATISVDGEALAWFQWEEGHRPVQSWMESKPRLLDRFG